MKKKILIGATLLAIFTGCGQQPELDVNADQNKTAQEQNKTKEVAKVEIEKNLTQPKEEELNNKILVNVTDESENSDKNDNEKTAAMLSKNIVYFDFDKYNIRDDQMPMVKAVADILLDVNGTYTVRIEGNCDEWGSDEYNYALGLKRAKAVKSALVDLGVDENRLTIISYGESNPVCTAHNKDCWAKNRRDNFTLLP